MNRLFITGDTHGEFERFSFKKWPVARELDKTDIVVICGDFGGIFYANGYRNSEENYWLNWLERRPFTTCFIAGNHENHPRLNAYKTEIWNGGFVHKIRPSIIHLMDGCVFNLNGQQVFTFGRASSHDKQYRTEGKDWWPEELPTRQEIESAFQSLDRANWSVDYIVTHSLPDKKQKELAFWYEHDIVTNALQIINERLDYRMWYSGHYHLDRQFDPTTRLVYYDILEMATYEKLS